MTTRTAAPPTATRFAGAVLALALTLSGALGGPLDRSVEILISNTNLGRATIAIHAVDLDTGREIVSHNAGTPMIPASNMKIVSSGAALLTLGESFAFRTEIRIARDGERTSLIIVGSGDPALGDPAFYEGMGPDALTHDDLFDAVASALRERGIGRVDEVVVDDRIFDREWAHDCWPRDQLNRWYCAEVGGLNFHTNVINMYPIPGTAGATPAVRTQPELPWITIHNRAKTITRGRNSVWVSRPNPENTFTLMGNVRGKTEIPVSVHEPSRVAGELFALALEDRGIEISPDSSVRDAVRLAESDETWPDTITAAVITTPLDEILTRTNTDSYNLYAECLLKRTGHEVTGDPGSWENGASVVRLLLADRLGTRAVQGLQIYDGSGMCRDNRLTPESVTAFLSVLDRDAAWETFIESFATPGEGTLRRRFLDGELACQIRGKSGYLNGVYALSGVLIHEDGRRVAFSIMLNDVKSGAISRRAKPFIDSVVREVDQWIAETAPALGG